MIRVIRKPIIHRNSNWNIHHPRNGKKTTFNDVLSARDVEFSYHGNWKLHGFWGGHVRQGVRVPWSVAGAIRAHEPYNVQ